ncbi:MAG TPA: NAD(P)-dependent oxidoreductase [Puia sp.]|jgi:3-hydroxyisobutyrate dehydrogenase|nr:NAD(P)-dependent oxidoreductase [Puia sp.]
MIAFLGTGLLGSNFVKALLKKGHQVQVWNRTTSKAKALELVGAKAFQEPSDAVQGAERIHLTLSDDEAVDSILQKASAGFKPGVIIIDHTTTSASGAAKRTAYWKAQGFIYIHAPVFMGPPNALDSTGYMLISGDPEIIKKLEPELSAMTGKLINFGMVTNKAAGMKLLGNLFLMSLTAGLSDCLALAKSLNIPASDIEALFNNWNPGSMVPARLKRILSNQFSEPSWELKMARKDARLMIEAAEQGRCSLTIIPAIAKEMDRWIEKGHGNDDWTVIAKDNASAQLEN